MNDQDYMKEAVKEARKALALGEVPIGAIIVKDKEIIARGFNRRETDQQTTQHAEIIAIKGACTALKSWRLESCTLYVTQEPCVMCSGAIIQARIPKVRYGTTDLKNGAHVSQLRLYDIPFNHRVDVRGGILKQETSDLIKDFFSTLRKQKNNV